MFPIVAINDDTSPSPFLLRSPFTFYSWQRGFRSPNNRFEKVRLIHLFPLLMSKWSSRYWRNLLERLVALLFLKDLQNIFMMFAAGICISTNYKGCCWIAFRKDKSRPSIGLSFIIDISDLIASEVSNIDLSSTQFMPGNAFMPSCRSFSHIMKDSSANVMGLQKMKLWLF